MGHFLHRHDRTVDPLVRPHELADAGLGTDHYVSRGAHKLIAALETSMPNGLDTTSLAGHIAGLNNRLQFWVANSQWIAASSGRTELEEKKAALIAASKARPRVDDATLQRMSDEIAAIMLKTVQRLALLESQIRTTAEVARYPVEDNTVPAPDLSTLTKRLAEAYGPAAAAGLAYFESTAVGLRTRVALSGR